MLYWPWCFASLSLQRESQEKRLSVISFVLISPLKRILLLQTVQRFSFDPHPQNNTIPPTRNIKNESFEPKKWAPDRPTKSRKMYLHRIFYCGCQTNKKWAPPWRCWEKTSSIFVLTNTKIDWQQHELKRTFWFALFGTCSRLFFVPQKLCK